MQNEQTLISIGFNKNSYGEWFFRTRKNIFVGKVCNYCGPKTFVELFKVSKETDLRPMSERRGRKFQTLVAHCCSEGSVERRIKQYDNN